MTGDPERLLSGGSHADPLERELLGSVRHVGPPDGMKDQAWRALAGQIAVVAAVGAATGSSAAAATKVGAGSLASWAMGAKVAAVVAASSLAVGGGYLALKSQPRAPSASATAATAPKPMVARAAPKASAGVELSPAPVAPIEESRNRRLEPRRLDLLKAESALLTDARAQLRAGNPAGAQASLERLQAQFPKGMLTQEREVLAIEVLYARGNVDGAKRRAQAFIRAYPRSPHSAKLSRFVE